MHRLLPFVALLGVTLSARVAAASGCFLGPFASAPQLGCEVTYHRLAEEGGEPPRLWVDRDDARIDVTGTVRADAALDLDVPYTYYACDGTVLSHDVRSTRYDVFHLAIEGAQAGEILYVDGAYAGPIARAGTCAPLAEPQPACTGSDACPVDDDPPTGDPGGDDAVGCAASGGGSLAALVFVLGALGARRRGSRGRQGQCRRTCAPSWPTMFARGPRP